MTAPLTRTRNNKTKILLDIDIIIMKILTYPRSSLDRMDYRRMKKIIKELNVLHERAKPPQN